MADTKVDRGLLLPIFGVESAFFVDPLIRVGTEVVALGLDEVGGQAVGAEGVEIGERGRETHRGDAVRLESGDSFA